VRFRSVPVQEGPGRPAAPPRTENLAKGLMRRAEKS